MFIHAKHFERREDTVTYYHHNDLQTLIRATDKQDTSKCQTQGWGNQAFVRVSEGLSFSSASFLAKSSAGMGRLKR